MLVILLGTVVRIFTEEPRFNAADEAGYFAWQQSVLSDCDLNPTDDLLQTYAGGFPSWKRVDGDRVLVNKYSTGISQAIFPFTAPTFLVLGLSNQILGTRFVMDGFDPPMIWAGWLAVAAWSCGGLAATFAVIVRLGIGRGSAAIATICAWAGTAAFAHSWKMSLWSHGIGMSVLACAMYLIVRVAHGHRSPRILVALGAMVGLAIAVRATNAVLLGPIVLFAVLHTLALPGERRKWSRPEVLSALLLALPAMLIPICIELGVRKYVYGEWLFNGYAFGGEGFHWPPPYIGRVLFHLDFGPIEGGRGVVPAHPVVLVAIVGLLFLASRAEAARRWFAVSALASIALMVVLYGAWWFWDLGYSFGARWSADLLPIWAIGIATAIHTIHARPIRSVYYLLPMVVWSLVYCSGGLSSGPVDRPPPDRWLPGIVRAE